MRLSDEQLDLIDRIRSGKMASRTVAAASPHFEFQQKDPFPLSGHAPAKRNFMPSKWEQMKVNKILEGLLSGRIRWSEEEEEVGEQLYDAWGGSSAVDKGVISIAPQKAKLPDHN